MPTNRLPSLDDRGHRRLFSMLSLLAASDGPTPRTDLLRRAERLVPLTELEKQRVRESEGSEQERRQVDRDLTRAYETLRSRGLLAQPRPGVRAWELTDQGRQAVAAAEGSETRFWAGLEEAGDHSLAPSYPEPVLRAPAAPLNQILYGPPGTGKTYSTVDAALMALADPAAPESIGAPCSPEDRQQRLKSYREHVRAGRVEFVTFHQAYSYEDFVEGFRPVTVEGHVQYKIQDGIFFTLVDKARREPDDTFVLVIDEINRGNVAGGFGELITLIEDGKRIGQAEEQLARLPYSNRMFGVPTNLHLVGTMNTADRSLAGVDLALRRRFDFVEMPPRADLLKGASVEGVQLEALLQRLNERLHSVKGRDFAIGHAFFMSLIGQDEPPSITHLRGVFERKVLPLLQEYFFEDDEQIAHALGQEGGRSHRAWDYLRRQQSAARMPNGGDVWRAHPEVLSSRDFYLQVIGTANAYEEAPPADVTSSGEDTSGTNSGPDDDSEPTIGGPDVSGSGE